MQVTGRQYVIAGLRLLQHQPHARGEIGGVTPITPSIEIADIEPFLQTMLNRRHRAGDFSRDEGLASRWALVVEQDAIRGVDAVGLAVVDGNPVGVKLGNGVWRSRIKGVVSRCGLSCALPKSSEVEAW